MDKYDKIYDAVIKKAPYVDIDGGFDRRDAEIFFNRYPKALALLSGFQVGGGMMGITMFSRSMRLILRYFDLPVDVNTIFVVRNEEEIINTLEKFVTRYDEDLGFVVPNQNMYLNARKRYAERYAIIHPYLAAIGESVMSMGSTTVVLTKLQYHVNPKELKKIELDINNEVNRVVKMLFEPGMSKLTKALLAHNYLATLAVYDHMDVTTKFNPYSHSAYGTLINHKSVCHGFADAFKRLCNRGGVKCEIVAGDIIGSTEKHAWNLVYISDTEVYHVDVTWDIVPRLNYRFFLKGDGFMSSNRMWKREIFPVARVDIPNFIEAKQYVRLNREKLVSKGIDPKVLFV